MVMARKEMKEMRNLLVEKVEKSMRGKVKEMEKNVVEQLSKRNDDGSIPESGDGSKRDKIYH